MVSALGSSLHGPSTAKNRSPLIPRIWKPEHRTMASSMVPDELGQIVPPLCAGDRDGAVRAWGRLLPLSI